MVAHNHNAETKNMTDSTYMSPDPDLVMKSETLADILPKKRPLVALLMADCFCDPILNGEKKITIREGWRDYQPGEKVVLCRAGDVLEPEYGWAFMAKIISVDHLILKDAPIQHLQDDGMKDLQDAVSCLREFYPDINENSPITIIRWELI